MRTRMPLPPSFASLATGFRYFFILLYFFPHAALALANPAKESSLTATILSPPCGAIPIGKSYIGSTSSLSPPSSTITATTTPPHTNLAALSAPPITGTTPNTAVNFSPQPPLPSGPSDVAALSNICGQMVRKTTAAIVTLSSLIGYVTLNSIARAVKPSTFIWYEEDKDEGSWIASSPSWLDRKACRWLGLCGTAHFHAVRPRFGYPKSDKDSLLSEEEEKPAPWAAYFGNETDHPESTWDATERSRRQIPEYVFEYAPLVHLFSGEQFWPCNIAEHLYHITPMLGYTPIQSQNDHPTLWDLDELNQWHGGRGVFLTSDDDVEERPPWMEGEKNVPDVPEDDPEPDWDDWDDQLDGAGPDDTPEERAKWYDTKYPGKGGIEPDKLGYPSLDDEKIRDELRKRYGGEPINVQATGGRSEAPAILLVIDKGNGIIDAFWFYFYSFNLGNDVFNVRFGNHIGDWEHCLMRFHNGNPKALFFSAHAGGEAYSYEAVEKLGKRPVIYSASGTHAMYATPGVHSYILPWGLLHDETDRGPLWDPLLNAHTYTYDHLNDTLRASTLNPSAPTAWFYFNGHWGDKFYPLSDHRQYRFAGQYHYVNGPLGPRFKRLRRRKVCQTPDKDPCVIKDYIGEQKRAKRWSNYGPESAS